MGKLNGVGVMLFFFNKNRLLFENFIWNIDNNYSIVLFIVKRCEVLNIYLLV